MPWYAAHIVMRIRYREGSEQPLYVQENIVLLEASTPEDARERAVVRGRADGTQGDQSLTCDGRSAFWEFAGVRLVTSCEDGDGRLASGTEVSYIEYRVEAETDLRRLLRGEDVRVEFGG